MYRFLKELFTKQPKCLHLIPYIVSKDYSKIRQFIQSYKNRDKARREIINLKKIISDLEPLFYDLLVKHSSKVNDGFFGPASLNFRDTETGKDSMFSIAYKFLSEDYCITFGKCSKSILYCDLSTVNKNTHTYFYDRLVSKSFCYNQTGMKINLTDIQFDILCELQQYCERNRDKIEEFKKESSLQKVLQMR